MNRRQFVKAGAASMFFWQTSNVNALNQAKLPQNSTKKVVWVILRGALDPLHTVVPMNDKHLLKWRPTLYPAIKDDLLPISNGFGLHPSLKSLHSWYKNKELIPVLAVSSGYGKRSHFEAQDYLESGLSSIDTDNGWLARAIDVRNKKALAVANTIPVSLRGLKIGLNNALENQSTSQSSKVDTWYPSNLKNASDQIYDPLLEMYQEDERLLTSLESGLKVRDIVNNGMQKTKNSGNFVSLSRACGRFMAQSDSIDCAMLDVGGWDTHKGQIGRLQRQLKMLDSGLLSLKQELGKHWQDTVVVIATEFGRTIKENGTGGTDHGTGSALLFAGGAVNGGQVLGNWPGLAKQELFKERDLRPTSNTFSWIATMLSQHWQLTPKEIEYVFPTATPVRTRLVKAKETV